MRGTPSTFEHFRQNGQSLRPAGEKVAWPQPMTDEGDHGGAPVIDGPLRTAAPTKAIVTLCRGGCPHPPVRWPSHPTRPTLIRPFGAPSPWKGEGFIRSDASFPSPCVGILQSSPAAMPASPIPFVPSGHFPLIRGIGLSQGGLFEQHISPPRERGDTAEGGGGIPSPRPKPSPPRGEGFIHSHATAQSPSAFPSSGPAGHLPQGKADSPQI